MKTHWRLNPVEDWEALPAVGASKGLRQVRTPATFTESCSRTRLLTYEGTRTT